MDILGLNYYHIPTACENCGGLMIFKGVGEYQCENCGHVAFDDYGKVRLYIEKHRGATAADIEQETGVPGRTIRRMLREDRIEVAKDSKIFLKCEFCGKDIRGGRFCKECEMNYHRAIEERERKARRIGQGYGMEDQKREEGERRFTRRDKR